MTYDGVFAARNEWLNWNSADQNSSPVATEKGYGGDALRGVKG